MLTKMVNGEEIILSDEEEAEVRARWASKPPPTRAEVKRARLIRLEIEAAKQALVNDQRRTDIENMNDAALDAAIAALDS